MSSARTTWFTVAEIVVTRLGQFTSQTNTHPSCMMEIQTPPETVTDLTSETSVRPEDSISNSGGNVRNADSTIDPTIAKQLALLNRISVTDSICFAFFDRRRANQTSEKVSCKVCKKELTLHPKTTSNLNNHCTKFHAELWNHLTTKRSHSRNSSSSSSLKSVTKQTVLLDYTARKFSQSEFEIDLMKWIVHDEQAFAVLKCKSFRYLMGKYMPQAILPRPDKLSQDIKSTFAERKGRLLECFPTSPAAFLLPQMCGRRHLWSHLW